MEVATVNRSQSPPSTLLIQSSIGVSGDISTDVIDNDAHRVVPADDDLSTIPIPDHVDPIPPEQDGEDDGEDAGGANGMKVT